MLKTLFLNFQYEPRQSGSREQDEDLSVHPMQVCPTPAFGPPVYLRREAHVDARVDSGGTAGQQVATATASAAAPGYIQAVASSGRAEASVSRYYSASDAQPTPPAAAATGAPASASGGPPTASATERWPTLNDVLGLPPTAPASASGGPTFAELRTASTGAIPKRRPSLQPTAPASTSGGPPTTGAIPTASTGAIPKRQMQRSASPSGTTGSSSGEWYTTSASSERPHSAAASAAVVVFGAAVVGDSCVFIIVLYIYSIYSSHSVYK